MKRILDGTGTSFFLIDDLTLLDRHLSLNLGRKKGGASRVGKTTVLFDGYPQCSISNLMVEEYVNFVRSEWAAAMTLVLGSSERLLNANAFQTYASLTFDTSLQCSIRDILESSEVPTRIPGLFWQSKDLIQTATELLVGFTITRRSIFLFDGRAREIWDRGRLLEPVATIQSLLWIKNVDWVNVIFDVGGDKIICVELNCGFPWALTVERRILFINEMLGQ
ncbi:hypothetical protein [Acidisoma sp. S159]|uniref:hypothetical protein n=1 Tax=Acidisoma sp. S159 TaxID=1747225 RepID=UPI00131E5BD0|nr:hypothetical protein [Acidisoma sp. S159]